jgi:enoyl-CoA hydratase/carnithine racemase
MTTEKILFRESDGVATLILNRPDKGNAVDLDMMRAIEESFGELNENKRSRVLVIRGEGEDFCARLDLGRQDGGVKETIRSRG